MGLASPPVAPLAGIARRLGTEAGRLRFAPPVAFVYNPLAYARGALEAYLSRARRAPEALFLGMNPGPFGMVQTGIPFGEVAVARDWLGIDRGVAPPAQQHPKRPVLGFASPRSEVSGRRLWGWARNRFGEPDRFFERFFVWNYCPLAFLESSGRNLTPDKLPASERDRLFSLCDDSLRAFVAELAPRRIVGVGAFAAARARIALDDTGLPVGSILHPSPASPAANRGWERQMEEQLREFGIDPGGPAQPSGRRA